MPRIVIRSKNGQFTVKSEGFIGTSCVEATRGLEQRLGVRLADTPTDEMYREPEQDQTLYN